MRPKRRTRDQRVADADDAFAAHVMEFLREEKMLPGPKRCAAHREQAFWRRRGGSKWICEICHPGAHGEDTRWRPKGRKWPGSD